jgi:hypothetical protein
VSGDGPVAGSSAGMFQYVVGDGNVVAVAATSSPNPAAPGQPVGFSATLTPPAGGATPTGNVTFTDGSMQLCVATVVDSTATCTGANPTAVGGHRIVATYGGDGNYSQSYGVVYQQTIPGVTQTTVTAQPTSEPVFGQPVTLTARVTLATGDTDAGEITGTVTFAVDGQSFGDAVAVGDDGTATSGAIDSLSVGNHRVVVSYSGNADLLPSTGNVDVVVHPARTSLHIAASAEPSASGSPVTFTATVIATAPGAGSPSGTVQFTVDGDDLGGQVAVAGGIAVSPATSSLTTGDHTVMAVFTPADDSFVGSDASITHLVDTGTHLQLGSSANPSGYGDTVTFTATVTPSVGTVSEGTVVFTIDGGPASGCDAVAVSHGAASCDVPLLAAGQHTVAAAYSGTHRYAASAAQLAQSVEKATSATVVTSSVNPSAAHQEVSFTARVTTDVDQPMGGTVQFTVDGVDLGGPVPLVGSTATSAAVTNLDRNGRHDVVATYSGDANALGSSGEVTQWVGANATVTTVTSSDNPTVFRQKVSFTATVSADAATPTGSVRFIVDGEAFGDTIPLIDGSATSAKIATLSAGGHRVVAEFVPDAPFASSSGVLVQTVGTAASTVELDSAANPSTVGSAVTFTATVAGPGSATPTGVVQFSVDGQPVGLPVVLVNGQAASPPVSGLSAGVHDVVANYLGDGDHSGSSAELLQRVLPASSTSVTSSAAPSVFGQPVTFAAVVTGDGTHVPTGTVQFTVDGAAFGDPVALHAGRAESGAAGELTVGDHAVTAAYSGDTVYGPSAGVLTQTVGQAATSTSVASSANPSADGDSVTFTATVAAVTPGSGSPSGVVQFSVDGQFVGLPVAVTDALAVSPAVSGLALGDHDVAADYLGDGSFTGSSATLVQTVASGTTTTLTSSQNPSKVADAVTFTATIAESVGSGTTTFAAAGPAGTVPAGTVPAGTVPTGTVPTGTVQFSVDGTAHGHPVDTVDGVASISIADLSAGEHTVTATFTGAGYAASSGVLKQRVAGGTPPTPPPGPPVPPGPPHGNGSWALPDTGSDLAPFAGLGMLLLALGAAASITAVRVRKRTRS